MKEIKSAEARKKKVCENMEDDGHSVRHYSTTVPLEKREWADCSSNALVFNFPLDLSGLLDDSIKRTKHTRGVRLSLGVTPFHKNAEENALGRKRSDRVMSYADVLPILCSTLSLSVIPAVHALF